MKIGVTSEPLKLNILIVLALIVSVVFFAGCTQSNQSNAANKVSSISTIPVMTNKTTNTEVNTNTNAGGSMVNKSIHMSNQSNPMVTFVTTKGTFKAEIYQDKAPISAANFIKLVKSGFYNNLTFHRYEPGFVIQGGDPRGDGTGGSNETIQLEIVKELTHVKGSFGMARTMDPDSATSQFYISLEDIHQLDGNYAVFGQVRDGMDVVLKLRKGDKMTKVTVD